jgi:hypothetical protein
MKFCGEIPNQSPMIHILEIATVVELTPFINQLTESPNTRSKFDSKAPTDFLLA